MSNTCSKVLQSVGGSRIVFTIRKRAFGRLLPPSARPLVMPACSTSWSKFILTDQTIFFRLSLCVYRLWHNLCINYQPARWKCLLWPWQFTPECSQARTVRFSDFQIFHYFAISFIYIYDHFSKRVKIVVLKMAVLKSLHEILRCRTPKWLEFFFPHGNEKDLKYCVLLQHKKVCGV